MSQISPIAYFDDPSHDPFRLDEQAYGDLEDIYGPIARLMAQAPVHAGEFLSLMGLPGDANMSSALGFDEVVAVDRDAETFSIDGYKHGLGQTFGNTLSLLNPPEHTAIRRVFQQAFLPHIVSKWGDHLVTPVVHGLIDGFVERGEADLAEAFARKYPFEIIYRQLALPERDIATFHKLAVSMTQVYGPFIDYGREASRKLGVYFTELIAERRRRPGDDLVSLLLASEVDGERVPDEVMISFFRQLINAAGDTTYRGTGALLTALLRDPDGLAEVRDDRSLIPQTIEEALRWDGPVTLHNRTAMRDVTLAGVEIPEGANLNVCIWAANHDPKVFPDPTRFDIHRERQRHLGFGHGVHMCLGQHLARLEMTRALNAVLDRLPNLRLDPAKPPPRVIGVYLRTPRDINVRFDPPPRATVSRRSSTCDAGPTDRSPGRS
jgi:cytochrome P450